MLIYKYLPLPLQPSKEEVEDIDSDEFLKLVGMAQVSREMEIENITVGVNKGYVAAHKEE